ncbi:hypothetical protein M3215_07055 [Bacillus cytotoxicus]|uniref:Uncharacterized protein n=1 Tax=Bacillus cytotoxicus TaxID=580165 RepID=A0ACC6A6B6_9BACI|nr:hypothetical protein [Bacillus cytotoxicus]
MRVDKTLSELWHLRGNTDGSMTREEYEKEAQDIAFMAINAIKKLQEEISLLKASRGASIHEYRQLSNKKMKLKEENEFLRDDVQIRDERIEELKKELYALKRAASKS